MALQQTVAESRAASAARPLGSITCASSRSMPAWGSDMRRIVDTVLLFALSAAAQQIGQNSGASNGPPTFSTSTQLVVETVSVKDKSGKSVEGLTGQDFTVTEDGMAQTIRFFEYQKLPTPGAQPLPAPSQSVVPLAKLPKTQLAPETPGNLKYRDRRLLTLYFDMSNMPVSDQLRAFDAARRFVETRLTSEDMVALMAYQGGAIQVLQDFTNDRDRLLSIIGTLIVGEDQNSGDDATAVDTGAAFGQDDTEFNLFNTDRQLSALQFAELVCISVDFLSLIERGMNAPSFEVLEKMAGALELPVKDLFDFRRAPVRLPRHVQR